MQKIERHIPDRPDFIEDMYKKINEPLNHAYGFNVNPLVQEIRTSGKPIDECITEYTNNVVDYTTYALMNWAENNVDVINNVYSDGLYAKDFDLTKIIQNAQRSAIETELFDLRDDIVNLAVFDEALEDGLFDWCNDPDIFNDFLKQIDLTQDKFTDINYDLIYQEKLLISCLPTHAAIAR